MEFVINPDGTMNPKAGGNNTAAQAAKPAASAVGVPVLGSSADLIKESNTQNFLVDVIEASQRQPVIVDFWAPWCGPCKQLGPMLEKLVKEAGGLVKMVKINVDENQDLAQQMRVQSIPAVYAFKNGQPVDGFMGAVPESQLKTFIGRLTGGAKPPLEALLDEADGLLAAVDAAGAGALYAEALAGAPDSERAIAGMIRAAVAAGQIDQAKAMIDGMPDAWKQKSQIASAISAVELASTPSVDLTAVNDLSALLENDPANHQIRFDLAMACFGAKQNEAAIDHLIEIVRRNRAWNEDAARQQLLKIFDAIGPTHELTVAGRRKLSAVLFS
ncbi:MAG: thioredoxin [Proteobacteria bacterium]|nr:thioredoxin [Pseudomonadota bacterium]